MKKFLKKIIREMNKPYKRNPTKEDLKRYKAQRTFMNPWGNPFTGK